MFLRQGCNLRDIFTLTALLLLSSLCADVLWYLNSIEVTVKLCRIMMYDVFITCNVWTTNKLNK